MENEQLIEKEIVDKIIESPISEMKPIKKVEQIKEEKLLLYGIIIFNILLILMLPLAIWKIDSKNKQNIDVLLKSTDKLNKEVVNLAKIMETKDVPTFSKEFKQINDNVIESKEILNNNIKVMANEIVNINQKMIENTQHLEQSKEKIITKIDNSFLMMNDYIEKVNVINKSIKTLSEKMDKVTLDSNEVKETINKISLKSSSNTNSNDLEKQTNELGFDLTLQGVMQTAKGYVAYVSGSDKNNTKTVAVGSKINGWEVKEIKNKSIVLEKDGEKREVFIDNLN